MLLYIKLSITHNFLFFAVIMEKTYLSKLYEDDTIEEKQLNAQEVRKELEFLANQKEIDTLLTLFILEKISQYEELITPEYYETSLKLLKYSNKYCVFNLRILRLVLEISCKLGKFVPISQYLLKIFSLLEKQNDDNVNIDWNTLKVGGDKAQSMEYIEFIVTKGLGLLYKNITFLATSLGFPEISHHLIVALRSLKIKKYFEDEFESFINGIEAINEHIIEFRSKYNGKKLSCQELKKIEGELSKDVSKIKI
ncbi:hypothetical protein EDEG_03231 [Edhazardia aedis USNM 41457]|uniref:Uncharacterized protein n=1 Tax=Edhazardia aedis (strain USNM 41457) TaxID=1003232 RepID=J9D449_EDHAE|nr:hypothetical protein EDEG_03231 [Edhazardia aedis USNM 41457]|eukprot:EJW02329.1 hypothetical protein EDEG_03231 [Edhazardia aedis USNM 41457]